MIVIGIDPGTARVGWSIITVNNNITSALAYGCINTEKLKRHEDRLMAIYQQLNLIISQYHPDCMSLEDLFFATNAKTAISVGQSRGVIILTAQLNKIPVISYTPLVVKQAICGSGSADKKQVGQMVKTLLKLTEITGPDDITDALAIGLTHVYSYKLKGLII